jgi:hypothetical protein
VQLGPASAVATGAGVRLSRKVKVALTVLVFLASAGLILGPLPEWIAPTVPGMTPDDKLKTVLDTRASLIQLLGGVALLLGLLFTAGTYRLAHRGQITDRFAGAVEQLANTSAVVRMGGIYALEMVGKDETEYAQQVADVLTAFVRDRAVSTGRVEESVQVALTILGRRDVAKAGRQIRLSGVKLRGVKLQRAQLQWVDLSGADLTDAVLVDANLYGASFAGAILVRTDLSSADLRASNLVGARLTDAKLFNAKLKRMRIKRSDADLLPLSEKQKREALIEN